MAGPRCTICDHANRTTIEASLPMRSVRSIAKQHGIGHSALQRHKVGHLQPALASVVAAREELSTQALVDRLVGYLEDAEGGIAMAKSKKDLAGLARCIKEARETAVYIGKTMGMWSDKATTMNDNRTVQINAFKDATLEQILEIAGLPPGS